MQRGVANCKQILELHIPKSKKGFDWGYEEISKLLGVSHIDRAELQ
jgi:hypothetical protein